jgi:nitrogen fixation NifU-like protein
LNISPRLPRSQLRHLNAKALTYSTTFKDHLAHPRNVGELPDPSAVAEETNPMCGDRMRISLMVSSNHISAVKYLAYGCPPTLVCGSVLTELIKGKKISQVIELTKADLLLEVGGLPSRKHHAAALAIETLQAALRKASTD